jgi:hypothetical protein
MTTAEASVENEASVWPQEQRTDREPGLGIPPISVPTAVFTSCKSPPHPLEDQTQSQRRNRSQSKPRTTTAD